MKIPFIIETQFNKIFKPQLVSIIETRIDGRKSKKFYGKSLVANFLQNIYANFNQTSTNFADPPAIYLNRFSSKNTVNANVSVNSHFGRIDGGAGALNRGIILGTGTTAPAPSNFSIETIINHGSGAGQLNYGAQQGIMGTTITGSLTEFTINRTYNNNSGGSITVNECAIYADYGGSVICIYRDLISPGDTINNGQVYDVLITFQITT